MDLFVLERLPPRSGGGKGKGERQGKPSPSATALRRLEQRGRHDVELDPVARQDGERVAQRVRHVAVGAAVKAQFPANGRGCRQCWVA